MKQIMKGITACGLAALLPFAGVCVQAAPQESNVQKAETEIQKMQRVLASADQSSEEAEKEEMVYVVTDPSGKPEETVVSVWLKNPDGKAQLKDSSDLTDIENIKGDETFTESGSGELTWDANGKDIYYQGNSKTELPVSTKISYTLDGKKMDPEQLAGAKGHLAVTFDYENKTADMRNVNGSSEKIYVPFLVLSGMMFDNAKAENLTVSSGKLINLGDTTIAVGYALPGLKESLDSNSFRSGADEFLPEQVTIEADVEDFSLLTTLTVIDNSLLNDLDLTNVNSLDDLKNAMGSMTDASGQLVDGTGKLYDGIASLTERVPDLTEGVAQLDNGAKQVEKGTKDLYNGARDLNNGATKLHNGTTALSTGADTLAGGAGSLSEGLNSIDQGAGALSGGLGKLSKQTAALPDSVDQLYQGAVKLSAALKNDQGQSVYGGVDQLEQGAKQISAGASGIQQGAEAISGGAGQISQAAGALEGEMTNMETSLGELFAVIQQKDPELYAQLAPQLSAYPEKMQAAKGVLEQIKAGADSIQTGAKSQDPANPGVYEAAGGIAQGAGSLADGASAVKSGIDDIVSEKNLGALTGGLHLLKEKSAALIGGIDQLSAGAKELSAGTSNAKAGAAQLSGGAKTLSDSVKQLDSGAAQLSDGSKKLYQGTARLKNGTVQLSDGTGQLKDGAAQLSDGAEQLLDGALQLKDGMARFDTEAVEKLASFVNGDATSLIERLKAVKAAGADYTTYSGKEQGTNGKVQFILRTDSIGE